MFKIRLRLPSEARRIGHDSRSFDHPLPKPEITDEHSQRPLRSLPAAAAGPRAAAAPLRRAAASVRAAAAPYGQQQQPPYGQPGYGQQQRPTPPTRAAPYGSPAARLRRPLRPRRRARRLPAGRPGRLRRRGQAGVPERVQLPGPGVALRVLVVRAGRRSSCTSSWTSSSSSAIGGGAGVGLYYLLALANFVVSLPLIVRRLHDTDRSGWWVLIGLIPFVGWIVLLVFACLPAPPAPTASAEAAARAPTAGTRR